MTAANGNTHGSLPVRPVRPEDLAELRASAANAVQDDKPVVFFVPGYTASKITVGGVKAFDYTALLMGAVLGDESGLRELGNMADPWNVEVPGLLDGPGRYYHIIQTLTETCREAGLADPVVCGYDWRQSVKFVAKSWVGPLIWRHVGNRKKAIIVAHSMGTLVAQYFLECMAGADVTLTHVAVGPPFRGSVLGITAMTLGGTLASEGFAVKTLDKANKSFPGLRSLLPTWPCIVDATTGAMSSVAAGELPPPELPVPDSIAAELKQVPKELPWAEAAAGKYQMYVLLNNSLPTMAYVLHHGGYKFTPQAAADMPTNGDDTLPWTSAWCPVKGTRHYLVNAHHPDLAKHPTTQSLLRQLFPLAGVTGLELQRKLDAIKEHAFTAGEPGEPQPDLSEHTPDVTVELPAGAGVDETPSVGVASKSGGKDFAKALLVIAGPDGPHSKEVFRKEISLTEATIETSVDQTLTPGSYTVTVTPVPADPHAAIANYQTFQGSINVLPSEAAVRAAVNGSSNT